MSSPSDNFVVNASQLSDIVKDWIDSAIESGTKNALEWLKQKLQEKIPNLDSDTVQSLASDISDYAEHISAFRKDLAQEASSGKSRQEWFYRTLKDIAGKSTDEELGQMLEAMGNGLLSQFEKTANEIISQSSDGPKIAQVTIFPDVPPKYGWNVESIKDRVFDISKVLTALTISGLSKIDSNSVANTGNVHFSDPEKFKDILLKDDQSKLIMAMIGALKEGVIKRVLILDIGESIHKDQNSHQPITESNVSHSTLPSQNIDLPLLAHISSQSVEFTKQCVSSENQPEKFMGGMLDSTMSSIAGIAKVILFKYGPILLQSLFTSGSFTSIIFKILLPILGKILLPIICKTLLPIIGNKISDLAVNTIIPKVGDMAKSLTHSIFSGILSKNNTIFNGIKSIVSTIATNSQLHDKILVD